MDAVTVSLDGEFAASAEFCKGKLAVHVWSTKTLNNLAYIFSIQKSPVQAMQFVFSDKYLVLVGKEKPYALLIYDWSRNLLELTSIVTAPLS